MITKKYPEYEKFSDVLTKVCMDANLCLAEFSLKMSVPVKLLFMRNILLFRNSLWNSWMRGMKKSWMMSQITWRDSTVLMPQRRFWHQQPNHLSTSCSRYYTTAATSSKRWVKYRYNTKMIQFKCVFMLERKRQWKRRLSRWVHRNAIDCLH